MVKYPASQQELTAKINAISPTWLERARKRTDDFRAKGKYEEPSSIWSEIKQVYMDVQYCKCAFCEREMEAVDNGKIEQDVEHFRPKGNIKFWKDTDLEKAGIVFAKTPDKGSGYYLLPYNIFNYAAACKPCNSILKKDYFPVGRQYKLDVDDPLQLTDEEAYLIYPIGDVDTDPEQLIAFYGLSPKATAANGIERNRALVTIRFFKLDDPIERKNLYRDRALIIIALHSLLEDTLVGTAAQKKAAKDKVGNITGLNLRHRNCARSYCNLFYNNPAEARQIKEAAVQFLVTIS